jgi:hypothetical protein
MQSLRMCLLRSQRWTNRHHSMLLKSTPKHASKVLRIRCLRHDSSTPATAQYRYNVTHKTARIWTQRRNTTQRTRQRKSRGDGTRMHSHKLNARSHAAHLAAAVQLRLACYTAATVGVLNVKCMPRQVRKPCHPTTWLTWFIQTPHGHVLTLPARPPPTNPALHPTPSAPAWPMLQDQAHNRGMTKTVRLNYYLPVWTLPTNLPHQPHLPASPQAPTTRQNSYSTQHQQSQHAAVGQQPACAADAQRQPHLLMPASEASMATHACTSCPAAKLHCCAARLNVKDPRLPLCTCCADQPATKHEHKHQQ